MITEAKTRGGLRCRGLGELKGFLFLDDDVVQSLGIVDPKHAVLGEGG